MTLFAPKEYVTYSGQHVHRVSASALSFSMIHLRPCLILAAVKGDTVIIAIFVMVIIVILPAAAMQV